MFKTKRFIPRNAMLDKIGIGKTAQYKLERNGDFPARIQLTSRLVVWDEAEIDAWMESRREVQDNIKKSPHPKVALRKSVGHRKC